MQTVSYQDGLLMSNLMVHCRLSITLSYLQVSTMRKLNGMLVNRLINHHLHPRSHACPNRLTPPWTTLSTKVASERLPRNYSYFASPGQNNRPYTGPGLSALPLTKSRIGFPSLSRSPTWIALGMKYFLTSLNTLLTTSYQRRANLL